MHPQQRRTSGGEGEGGGFRPDIEGLRAVAVLLVLFYHARFRAPGGYVGVDVFFVLSGFLITGLLLRELGSTGRISMSAFYARRARRLLPAAALALLVTAVASAILLPPLRVQDVAKDIGAAGLYVSNMWFAFQATNYLASDLPPSPVLHFWSLGVEEQFYLFWPALLALVAGGAFAAGRIADGIRRVGVTLAVTFVVSLVLAVWLTGVQQPWAFFSLPTRAWELALGGLLALPAARRVPARLAPALGWLGLALVVASGLLLNNATPFPGLAALVPTVGSALVIASGLPRPQAPAADGGPQALVGRSILPSPVIVLGLAPVRYLGRISYSLYLWHWPILVLPAAVLGELPGPARLGLVVASILVAGASQRWVEEPIRHGRFVGLRPARVLKIAGGATLTVAALAVAVGAVATLQLRSVGPVVGGQIEDAPIAVITPTAAPAPTGSAGSTASAEPGATPDPGTPTTAAPAPALPPLAESAVPADLVPALAVARNDNPSIYADGCHVDQATVQPKLCVFGDPKGATTVLLFGDSHAAQWFPALERIADERGLRLVSMTKSGCTSVDVPVWNVIMNRSYDECTQWRGNVQAWIDEARPDVVVMSNSRAYQLVVDGAPSPLAQHEDLWAAGERRTLDGMAGHVGRVILLGDTPRMASDPPTCLSSSLDDVARCATPFARAVGAARLSADRAIAAETGAAFVDPTYWLCSTEPCSPIAGRLLIYRDEHHMTATFSRALAKPLAAATGLDRISAAAP